MTNLKSLAEHNAQAREFYEGANKGAKRNGIACPECGGERVA